MPDRPLEDSKFARTGEDRRKVEDEALQNKKTGYKPTSGSLETCDRGMLAPTQTPQDPLVRLQACTARLLRCFEIRSSSWLDLRRERDGESAALTAKGQTQRAMLPKVPLPNNKHEARHMPRKPFMQTTFD